MAVRFHDMFAVVPHSFLRIYGSWRTWIQINYGALSFRIAERMGFRHATQSMMLLAPTRTSWCTWSKSPHTYCLVALR